MSRKTSIFTEVPIKRPPRNLFDLGHVVKTSGKFGYIYPIMCQEALPGDTWRESCFSMIRLAPMLAPPYQKMRVKIDGFFVPTRLCSSKFEPFITGGQDGTEAPVLPYTTPHLFKIAAGNSDLMKEGTLWDYMGLPILEGADPGTMSSVRISTLPFRAYSKIWSDWFRDPNFDDELDMHLDVEGNDSANLSDADTGFARLRRRGFQRDYFTSCLGSAQRGAEVLLPLTGEASWTYKKPTQVRDNADALIGTGNVATATVSGPGELVGGPSQVAAYIDNIESIELDGGTTTINDVRTALAIQAWMEASARGGGRYSETVPVQFGGTRPPDYRLQRAEYLGGFRQVVTVSEVLATAGGENDPPVGDLAGHGLAIGNSDHWTYRCEEHGYIIMTCSVVFDTAYNQGIHRMFTRQDKYDYAWPLLAHLGEQEVKSKEIYFDFNGLNDDDNELLFGYIPRYSEYKYQSDRSTGAFRTTLAFWGLDRIFLQRPVLDEIFQRIDEGHDQSYEADFRRIFAVQDGTDYLWMMFSHRCTVKRFLPYFSVPNLVG